MSGIGERIKKRRQELGLSQPELARKIGGITYQAIQAVEKGGQTKHLISIAKALDVSPEWLQDGGDSGPAKLNASRQGSVNAQMLDISGGSSATANKSLTTEGSEDTLRVLGMAEGGPDGWNLWNGEVVQYIRRPDNLVGVPNAYAVFITGLSMIPRYRPGELAHVHPGKPVNPGDYVLVQRKPAQDGDPPIAVVKLLVKRTASKLILEQHNPNKTIDIPAGEVVSIHRIVGSSEG
jgi:phage repressor protein C with HTH and peptisase S24 domain